MGTPDAPDPRRNMATMTASSVPWVEKYRPRTIGDVAHQGEVVRTLEKALETANMPHMLFYGPPGTGKTTCALAICRQLFGPELFKQRVLELNASDDAVFPWCATKSRASLAPPSARPQLGTPPPRTRSSSWTKRTP